MHNASQRQLYLPSPDRIQCHVLKSLNRYWANNQSAVSSLPIRQISKAPDIQLPLKLISINLPTWAERYGIKRQLLVPREALLEETTQSNHHWKNIDWWLASFLLLEGWHERLWESQHGPIHSYSFRLDNWDERAWEHAWVNRIALFLRQWAIEIGGRTVHMNLGILPNAEIHMTHDVDAIKKTLPIRFKQTAFNLFNAARACRQGNISEVISRSKKAFRFLFSWDNWWVFDRLLSDEQSANIHATWHFYADRRIKTPKRWIFDPGYDINSPELRLLLQHLNQIGHRIGVHPGFETWKNSYLIGLARDQVQNAAGCSIIRCRQHWLRFSWKDTWEAQSKAFIREDTTLMFNDKPGFRTSCAINWRPWNPNPQTVHKTNAMPTVFMDSHFYDYQAMTALKRKEAIQHWLGECIAVHGQIAVLWHPHTLGGDYGWSKGFYEVLDLIKRN